MGLCHFHHGNHFCTDMSSLLCPNTHRKNTAGAAMRHEPIVYALLECPCAAIAWQVTSVIAKRIHKVASQFIICCNAVSDCLHDRNELLTHHF